MEIKIYHIHKGLMVNVIATNANLARRAILIASQFAGVSPQDAQVALDQIMADQSVSALTQSSVEAPQSRGTNTTMVV